MMRSIRILSSILLLSWCFNANAQVFLQLERIGTIKGIKILPSENIKFKLKEYPDTWRHETLDKIFPEENSIVLGGNIYSLSEFLVIQRPRKKSIRNLGRTIQYFGIAWSTFGGIAALVDDFEIGSNEIIVGAVAIGVGTLLRLFKTKNFKIGENSRLRIVDLRMTIP